jgi:chanoclavine-I dehydrogenase
MMTSNLNGKVFTVTGGASGMGAATARLLCQRGAAAVCIGDYNDQNFSTLDKELSAISPSTKIMTTKLDVSSSSQVKAWIESVVSAFGRLDGCANVAGVPQVVGARKKPTILEETDETWRRTMSVNLDGVMYCTREEVRAMVGLPKEPRSIVNVASLASVLHTPDAYAYGASKRACASLSSSVAKDVLDFGIRVNTVSPGTYSILRASMIEEPS